MTDKIEKNESSELTTKSDQLVGVDNIEPLIKIIRGQQVMLDRDLATLYGVETKRLNEQVKRNIKRFPEDFMFQLTKDECLRSQIATLNEGRGQHLKYMPYVFTENGVAMLSSVLRSDTAIEVNIRIMRAFTSMRHFLQNNAEVFQRLSTMEYHQLEMQQHQQETDKRIEEVFRRLDEGNAKPKQGVLSPTLTARWYSISSMFLSVKCSLRSATTFGIHLIFSMRKNSMRRRDCITMGQDTMTQD